MTEKDLVREIAWAAVNAYLDSGDDDASIYREMEDAVLAVLKKADVRLTLPYVLTETQA